MQPTSFPIFRTDNRKYVVDIPGRSVQFEVRGKVDAETSFFLVEKAAARLKDKRSFQIHYAKRKWSIKKERGDSLFLRILHRIFPFLWHKPSVDGIEKYEITVGGRVKKKKKDGKTPQATIDKHHLVSPFSPTNLKKIAKTTVPDFGRVEPDEFNLGIRGKILLSNDPFHDPLYQDPFTKLATLSYQRYEDKIFAPDGNEGQCHYCFIAKVDGEKEEIQIVHKESPLATVAAKGKALEIYRKKIEAIYGEKKVRQIDFEYDLKLSTIQTLTPEEVYKFNVGTLNTEVQGIKEELSSLLSVDQIESAKGRIPPYLLLRIKARGIDDSAKFLEWKELYSGLSLEEMDPSLFSNLIDTLSPNEEEIGHALTGRKITKFITSAYANAALGTYKPWIDQQELIQSFDSLKKSRSFASYNEQLAHIVVRKHLARRDIDNGYKVGALIPAPPLLPKKKGEPAGPVRYYRVTSCVTNQYTYSYTLESVCNDPSLPVIKLFRNTAPNSYALFASRSVANDFSHLNSPGYLGISFLDKYEREFFKERSIPLFVAYLDTAKSEEEPGKRRAFLKSSIDSLKKESILQYKPKSLSDLLREHDAILNDLYRSCVVDGKKGKNLKDRSYLSLYQRLVENHILSSKPEKEKKDARELIRHLMLFAGSPELGAREQHLIEEAIHAIDKWVFNEEAKKNQEALGRFIQEVIEPLEKIEDLEELEQAIALIAKERGELPENKKAENIVFTGHSLGGAGAQAALCRYITGNNRIPLSGNECKLYEFDSPGINRIDNTHFKTFLEEHQEVLQKLQVKFSIFRRQEAQDFVPCSGEAHLGAVYSEEEQNRLKSVLHFDAAVNERLLTSQTDGIANSPFIHATRFLEGERARTFIPLQETYSKLIVFKEELERLKIDSSITLRDMLNGRVEPKLARALFNLFKKKGYQPTVGDFMQWINHYETHMDDLENIAKEAVKRDFRETHFSPLEQGIFDDGKGKAFRTLARRVWKLPNTLEGILKEDVRKSVDRKWNIFRKFLFSNTADRHTVQEKYLDEKGCFVVTLDGGVVTQGRG